MWKYTPRQIAAFQFLAARRRESDLHQLLSCLTLSKADTKEGLDALKKQLAEWDDA